LEPQEVSEPKKIIPLRAVGVDDKKLVVTLSVGELRTLIREEIRSATGAHVTEERLLDIEEAAKVLSVSPEWLYHNRKHLPFARKLGHKLLRFSYVEMLRWMELKKV